MDKDTNSAYDGNIKSHNQMKSYGNAQNHLSTETSLGNSPKKYANASPKGQRSVHEAQDYIGTPPVSSKKKNKYANVSPKSFAKKKIVQPQGNQLCVYVSKELLINSAHHTPDGKVMRLEKFVGVSFWICDGYKKPVFWVKMDKVVNMMTGFEHDEKNDLFNNVKWCIIRKNPAGISEHYINEKQYAYHQLFFLVSDLVENNNLEKIVNDLIEDVFDFFTCTQFRETYMSIIEQIPRLHRCFMLNATEHWVKIQKMVVCRDNDYSLNHFMCDEDIREVIVSIYGVVPEFDDLSDQEKDFFFILKDYNLFGKSPYEIGTT